MKSKKKKNIYEELQVKLRKINSGNFIWTVCTVHTDNVL